MRAAWSTPGGRPDVERAFAVESEQVKAEPFVLSGAVRLEVPAPGDVPAARLHLWLVDDADVVHARTFVDAAPIEEPNRQGARS